MIRLTEKTPAEKFENAYLLGNGNLGVSMYGGVPTEEFLLNVDTLWSGSEPGNSNPEFYARYQQAQTMSLQGKYKEANNIINDEMEGHWSQAYLPLGSLYITAGQKNNRRNMPLRRTLLLDEDPFTDYERTLDIQNAVASVHYKRNDVWYTRQAFVSYPAKAAVIRLTAEGGSLDFAMSIDSKLRHVCTADTGALTLQGIAPDHAEPSYTPVKPMLVYHPEDKSKALRFSAYARVCETDGTVHTDGDRIYINDATYAVVIAAADTNFTGHGQRRDPDAGKIATMLKKRVEMAATLGYKQLLTEHSRDFRTLFDRVTLELDPPVTDHLPTKERLAMCTNRVCDSSLSALAVQYARYLVISGSREGTQPLNLQGLWNDDESPPWASNYTLNINTQMNYWPCEVWNLPECHMPLLTMVEELSKTGQETAQLHYHARGWVTHHNTDLWRDTAPSCEDASWSYWPMGGIWLCLHLLEHYRFTGDETFLRRIYPVLESAALFGMDLLVEDGGRLLTAPSVSPENKHLVKDTLRYADVVKDMSPRERFSSNSPYVTAITKGSTMDMTLLNELFRNVLVCAKLLQIEDEHLQEIQNALDQLKPLAVGKGGLLREWHDDEEECMPGMGHMSHLIGLYPGSLITAETPELFAGADKSLLRRWLHGGLKGGWPCAWAMCMAARIRNELMCAELTKQIGSAMSENLLMGSAKQIDAVFGWAAGVAEMLLQSHETEIELLPCLPDEWRDGDVAGMCARGGFTLAFRWKNRRLVSASVSSVLGHTLHLRAEGLTGCRLPNGAVEDASNNSINVDTKAGAEYELLFDTE